ncbi:hypothetical protein M0813_28459 [Anaeramoeba flamelloides]|uniref:Uncharacterized protein n=1 Tax=Anaeramoeba flamelloides TaxID=1746091 RepID=A0ABQ8XTF7_9EUKA|nr:hypothetical protein M0813_28459 [Anaeramoeba flamelloides]
MTEQENQKEEEPKLNVVPCLIIDLGTKFVRFGISSNSTPSTIVKTNHPNLHQKCTKPNEPALTFGRITNKEKIGTILSYARSTVKEQTIGESVMVIDTLFHPTKRSFSYCRVSFQHPSRQENFLFKTAHRLALPNTQRHWLSGSHLNNYFRCAYLQRKGPVSGNQQTKFWKRPSFAIFDGLA